MIDPTMIQELLRGGELDRALIERLARADPDELRDLLSDFLPDDRVEAVLARIAELSRALEDDSEA